MPDLVHLVLVQALVRGNEKRDDRTDFRFPFGSLAPKREHGVCHAPHRTGIVSTGLNRLGGDFPLLGHSGQTGALHLNREPSHEISLKKPTGPSCGEDSGLRLREDKRLPSTRLAFDSCFASYKPILDVLQRGRVRGRRGGSGGGDKTGNQYREAGESDERMSFPDMDLNYLFSRRTDGANPSKIWKFINECDGDKISWYISRLPYKDFLGTAYWFAVASKRKSDLGMRCQVCNESGKLNVHHRTYDTHGCEHKHMEDLCVLCEFCHGLFHGHIEHQPSKFKSVTKVKIKKRTVVPHAESDLTIPDGESVVLTKELINACRANGSFTNATLRAFGMTRATMLRGWPDRLIGCNLTRDKYRQAQEGRFHYNTGRLE